MNEVYAGGTSLVRYKQNLLEEIYSGPGYLAQDFFVLARSELFFGARLDEGRVKMREC